MNAIGLTGFGCLCLTCQEGGGRIAGAGEAETTTGILTPDLPGSDWAVLRPSENGFGEEMCALERPLPYVGIVLTTPNAEKKIEKIRSVRKS